MIKTFTKIISLFVFVISLSSFSAKAVELEFYFPVAVGGAAASTVEELSNKYMELNPGVTIKPIYAGSYTDATTKAITAAKGGNPPPMAVLIAIDIFKFYDEDLVLPWDDILSDEEKENWLGGFYPAFMKNSQIDGVTYGIPFQRSTPVLYYNKDAFREVGLDPDRPPQNWDEQLEYAKKLTKKGSDGNIERYGIRIPTKGFPSWLTSGLIYQNGGKMTNGLGTETFLDTPEVIEAVQYLVDLSETHKVMRPGTLEWGATPKAFFEGQTAMMWTTTGNLTNVRKNAPFDFGVAMLPAKKSFGVPTGGGNFYIFKGTPEDELQATKDFVKWMTAPDQAGVWSMATGYVAPRPDAWETQAMKDYVADFPPALVAKEQLAYADAEFSTYENPKTVKIFNTALENVMSGTISPADAMKQAQADIDKILKDYR